MNVIVMDAIENFPHSNPNLAHQNQMQQNKVMKTRNDWITYP